MTSVIVGLISGVVSSLISFVIMYFISPRIIIAPKIAESQEGNDTFYRIKVVNKSRFPLYNVDYCLYYCDEQAEGVITTHRIHSFKPPLRFISRYSSRDKGHRYAVRITYKIDKTKYPLNDHAFLRITFVATHGFTGTTRCFSTTFTQNDVVNGVFEIGKSPRVVQQTPAKLPVS